MTVPRAGGRLVARLASPLGTSVVVKIDGEVVARRDIAPTSWTEEVFELSPEDAAIARVLGEKPADAAPRAITIEATQGRVFGSLHYWMYAW